MDEAGICRWPRLGVEVSIIDSEGSYLSAVQAGDLRIRLFSVTIDYWEDTTKLL